MTGSLFRIVLLTAVYLMMLASADPWDVLVGLVLSAGLVYGLRGYLARDNPRQPPPLGTRLLRFVPLAARTIRDIVAGTWMVAAMVLHLRPVRRVGIVAVPIGERSPEGVAVSSMLVTLSPGSVLIDVDEDRGLMLFHVIGEDGPDGFRATFQEFYDRYQRHVFP